jgi:hypothetical protein
MDQSQSNRSKKPGRRYLIPGFLIGSCVVSLIEDFVGKEAYLKYANEHWHNAWITVPLAIIIILFCYALMAYWERRDNSNASK